MLDINYREIQDRLLEAGLGEVIVKRSETPEFATKDGLIRIIFGSKGYTVHLIAKMDKSDPGTYLLFGSLEQVIDYLALKRSLVKHQ